MNPSQQDLLALQDAIYKDKVERARKMSPEERFMEGLALSDEVLQRMLEGVMWQLGIIKKNSGMQLWNFTFYPLPFTIPTNKSLIAR